VYTPAPVVAVNVEVGFVQVIVVDEATVGVTGALSIDTLWVYTIEQLLNVFVKVKL
jgi:hypothetical protein